MEKKKKIGEKKNDGKEFFESRLFAERNRSLGY